MSQGVAPIGRRMLAAACVFGSLWAGVAILTAASPAQAVVETKAALLLDGSNTAAKTVPAATGPADSPLCARGDAALARNDWQSAKDAFEAAKAHGDPNGCGDAGLAKAEAERLATIPARGTSLFGDALPWLLIATAASSAFLVAVGFVAGRRQPPVGRRRRPPSGPRYALYGGVIVTGLGSATCFVLSEIGELVPHDGSFQDSMGFVFTVAACVGLGAFAYWAVNARRLSFVDFGGKDDNAPKDVSAMTAVAFRDMTTGTSTGVNAVDTDPTGDLVSKVLTATPGRWSKAALGIWKALTPTTDLTLGAQVMSDAQGVWTAAVTLQHRGRTVASELISTRELTLKEGAPTELEKAESPQMLAAAIASWLMFKLTSSDDPRRYGARSWLGGALAWVANRREDQTDRKAAIALFARARQVDDQNQAVRFSLANLEGISAGTVADGDAAADELAALFWARTIGGEVPEPGAIVARLATHSTAGSTAVDSPLDWRLAYGLGAALANRGIRAGIGDARASIGFRAAHVVLADLEARMTAQRTSAANEQLLHARILALTQSALCAIRAVREPGALRPGGRADWRDPRTVPLGTDSRVEYNLACATAPFIPSHPDSVLVFQRRLRVAARNKSLHRAMSSDPWLQLDPRVVAAVAEVEREARGVVHHSTGPVGRH